MGLRSRDSSQETVQIIHGQRKDFLFALLFFTDLQSEWNGVREYREKKMHQKNGKGTKKYNPWRTQKKLKKIFFLLRGGGE